MEVKREEKIAMLKTYLDSFKKSDRRSVSNSIYLGQEMLGLPKNYDDFIGFGKLGVSSYQLHIDYSIIKYNSIELSSSGEVWNSVPEQFREVGEGLSRLSGEELRLVTCLLWYNGMILNEEEKEQARAIKERMLRI
jgi:hypothetical protein